MKIRFITKFKLGDLVQTTDGKVHFITSIIGALNIDSTSLVQYEISYTQIVCEDEIKPAHSIPDDVTV